MAANEKFILEFITRGVENLDNASRKIDGLNQKVNGLATALLGVSFGNFIKGALQAADQLVDLSDATNISIASLKSLKAGIEIAGGNAKNLEKAIFGLFNAMEQANSGSLNARDAFAKVGVSLEDLRDLSEAEILEKTIRGLAEMPEGAERAAIQTQLLSRAMRSVNPQALLESLDPQKYLESEAAAKQAADRIAQLEEAYRNLQEGALRALDPILRLLGEKKLSIEAAEKIVKAFGITFALIFGAQAVAAVAGMVVALVNFNKTLAITAGLSNLLGKTPLGLILKLGAGAAAGAGIAVAIDQLMQKNDELTASATQAANAQASVTGQPTTPVPPGRVVLPATPSAGPTGRNQELDARQRAAIESQRRIEQSRIELMKYAQLQGANEITRINIEAEAEIKRARAEIFAKDNLTREQQEKEFEAKRKEIAKKADVEIANLRETAIKDSLRRIEQIELDTRKTIALQGASDIERISIESQDAIEKARLEIFNQNNLTRQEKLREFEIKRKDIEVKAEADINRIKLDQQNQLRQQRQGYFDTLSSMLGYEKSELQKINDQIAQQPEKYKEVGDQLRANAAEHDRNLRFIKEFNKEQERQRNLLKEGADQGASFATSMLELVHQHQAALKMLDATSESERTRIQETLNMEMKMAGFIRSRITDKVVEAQMADQIGDATAEQLQLLMDTAEAIELQRQYEKSLMSIRIQNAEQLRELTSGFDYAFRDSFEKYKENALDTGKQVRDGFQTFTSGMEDAFVKFAQGGKLEFKDLANSILADLARIAVRRMIVFAGTSLFGLPIPGMAKGGPVDARSPYIVGEQGPELFIPATAGKIVPNAQLGGQGMAQGGATAVTYNINAVDAASFRALVARDPSFIYSVTEQGRRNTPSRSR